MEHAPGPATGWVTDGGLETELVFRHGVDLPGFAAFPLLDSDGGTALLEGYYDEYVDVADRAGAGLVLETPTWRAGRDWGARLGADEARVREANRRAVELVRRVAERCGLDRVQLSGVVGPQGDGYAAEPTTGEAAAEQHAVQVRALAAAGVDVVHAMTLTTVEEAVGVVQAARAAGVPVGISFTVEVDGRLPDGAALGRAVQQVDEQAPPDWFGVNCAHPLHVQSALDGGAWQSRLRVLRPNASTMSHAQLDEAEQLDRGDVGLLVRTTDALLAQLPSVAVVGGCCGTGAQHVAALWGLPSGPGA